jgi:hypothetical protein
MIDLAKARVGDGREAVGWRDVCRRVPCAPQRAAVDGCDAVVGEPFAQPCGLVMALIRKVHVRGAGEPVFRAQRRRAVPHEEEARRRHGVVGG